MDTTPNETTPSEPRTEAPQVEQSSEPRTEAPQVEQSSEPRTEAPQVELDRLMLVVTAADSDAPASVAERPSALAALPPASVPALLGERERARLGSANEGERSSRLNGLGWLPELRAFRQEPKRPAPLRRALLRAIHAAEMQLRRSNEQRTPRNPGQLALARTLIGDLLRGWCDVCGVSFDGTSSDLQRLDELSAATGLRGSSLALLADLAGGELRARLRDDPAGAEAEADAAFLDAASDRFFSDLRSAVMQRLSTPGERALRRYLTLAAWCLAALLLFVGAGLYLWLNRPFRALPASAVGKPGAIEALYYNDIELKKLVLRRHVPLVFVNAYGSPTSGINADRFSIHFRGFLYFAKSERTTLCVENDDGARVYLHERRVIDDWNGHTKKQNCARVRVEKGWHPLRVEYFEYTGPAWLRLTVGPSPKRQQLVPSSHLCCRP